MASVDLTVRGGGAFGLCIAWEAARRGARVRLIEAVQIGAGSSGGIVGALSPHVPENWNPKKAFQLDSLLMAEAFWDGVSAASGLPTGYGRVGRVQPLADLRLALAVGAISTVQFIGTEARSSSIVEARSPANTRMPTTSRAIAWMTRIMWAAMAGSQSLKPCPSTAAVTTPAQAT